MNTVASPQRKACLLILGMHRSGTSALTRCMNLLGMDLGANLLSPERMNAKGFWEHADAVRINDELLASFGMQWHSLSTLPDDWMKGAGALRAREQIGALIDRDFKGVPLWGIKDPRMCRLAPLWTDVLMERGIEVASVLMIRSPVEVAASLLRAHGIALSHGVILWLLHLIESDHASRSMRRSMVSYEGLLAEPLELVKRIGTDICIRWPILPDQRREALLTFLDEGLRSHRSASTESALPPLICRAAECCRNIVSDPSPAHWEALQALSGEAWSSLQLVAYNDRAGWGMQELTVHSGSGPQATVYFASEEEPFSDVQAKVVAIPVGRHQLDFRIDEVSGRPFRLRFDPLNTRGAYVLHGLTLLDAGGRVIWDAAGRSDAFDAIGVQVIPAYGGSLRSFMLSDEDPQLTLRVPFDEVPDPVLLRADLERLSMTRICDELQVREAQRYVDIGQLQSALDAQVEATRIAHEELAQKEAEGTAAISQLQAKLDASEAQLYEQIREDERLRHRLQEQLSDYERSAEQLRDLISVDDTEATAMSSQNTQLKDISIHIKAVRDALDNSQLEIALHLLEGAKLRQELAEIRTSTLWRACLAAQGLLVRVPEPVRRQLRRAIKAVWWCVTPWRTRARLRYLRSRKQPRSVAIAPVGATRAFVPAVQPVAAPKLSTISLEGEGRYVIADGGKSYVYIPSRKPADFDAQLSAFKSQPLFSIVVPVYNTPQGLLSALVRSIEAQWYPCWELILVDDNSSMDHVKAELASFKDQRIKVIALDVNKRIAGATNEGIAHATGDYLVFADHDDELTADCLFQLAMCIDQEAADFIYSDEDKIDSSGQYVEPFFKPDWSPDALMSTMYTCHVCCVRRSLAVEVGGLRSEYDGAQDWDFVLRITERTERIAHIPKILYHWRIIPESIASNLNAKPYAIAAGRKAREDALVRRGRDGFLEPVEEMPGYFRTVYRLQGSPVISIIIPSKNNHRILRQCIESIDMLSSYTDHELVIIDNGSTDADTIKYVESLRRRQRTKVIAYNKPFNYSAINNFGAAAASGDLLVFLNDDTEVITADWLDRLGGYAQLPHVGAVGAKLLYPGAELVQHAGIVNLMHGPGHAFLRVRRADPCYYAKALLEYDWIAVTGACLAVEKKKFLSLGGFDEAMPIAYNDVDLCFRLFEAGYFNVVCQSAELIHHESLTRGHDHADPAKMERLRRERQALYLKHPFLYQHDPFHSPNLAPNDVFFGLPG